MATYARGPTRKPKVSRVTSGYGGDMIPSSRVRPSPKKGGYMGVLVLELVLVLVLVVLGCE